MADTTAEWTECGEANGNLSNVGNLNDVGMASLLSCVITGH